jgi:hypothetical protein
VLADIEPVNETMFWRLTPNDVLAAVKYRIPAEAQDILGTKAQDIVGS